MKKWEKKELDDAKDFGGKLQIGSGRTWKNKLDVKTDDYLIEAKCTEKKSYSLKLDLWMKVMRAAVREGRTPILSLRFERENQKPIDLVILDKNDYINLTN